MITVMDTNLPSDSKAARIAEQLPHYIKEETIGFSSNLKSGSDVVTDFVDKLCSPELHTDLRKSVNKNFILAKFKVKPESKVEPRSKKTHLSLREKRKLGLYSLPRNGLKYQEFLKLNDLWRQYMLDSLDFPHFAKKKTEGEVTMQDKNWEQLSGQLYKADYHGAQVTVVRSRCPSHVGTQGIVVMDTKNTFKVLGRDNILRTIPKESSVFEVRVDQFKITIYGQHLCVKPAERSTKKVRNNLVKDL